MSSLSTTTQNPAVLEKPAAASESLGGWLCGTTIFISACLLFLVQPILGKIVLPWFGGSAGVWAACLVYFQASLLVGYAYAHALRHWLTPKQQAIVHILLLAVSLAFLPILPSPIWRQPGHADPAFRILGLLVSTVGLPCVLISATSPLLQAWYADLRPKASVYRLYALSNVGSMIGLLSFPLLVEPRWSSSIQARDWSWGYGAFALICVITAGYTAWRTSQSAQTRTESDVPADAGDAPPVSAWIAVAVLAACGSALLLAVTNHLSQNVAPIPLLWILPLMLYLLTFVLCFETERVYQRLLWIPLMMIGLGAMAWVKFVDAGNATIRIAVPIYLAGLFVCCMVCHGELSKRKPPARFLTWYFLLVSAGGVVGGFFVAIVAPHIFDTYAELPLLMVFCAALTAVMIWRPSGALKLVPQWLARVALLVFVVALGSYLFVKENKAKAEDHLWVRNFYGALRVQDESMDPAEDGTVQKARSLLHGTIEHGAQMLDPRFRDEPTSYYVRTSGLGLAEEFTETRVHKRVGIIGLGAGVGASYCRPEDFYRYYEINPQVEPISRGQFTFLNDCQRDLRVLLGDARLTLESQPPQNYDILAVDAFSGDAIPVHLMTREAFVEYFRHLKSAGILAIHVSNRYLDLVPVVARIAESLDKRAVTVEDSGNDGWDPAASTWVLLSSTPSVFDDKVFEGDNITLAETNPKVRLWTDDYSNLLQVMDFGKDSGKEDDDKDKDKDKNKDKDKDKGKDN